MRGNVVYRTRKAIHDHQGHRAGPQSFDLEKETLENTNYRTVAWSGKYLQLTLMSIPVGGDVGLEAHPDTDQFLRLDGGQGPGPDGAREGPARLRP